MFRCGIAVTQFGHADATRIHTAAPARAASQASSGS
jgi:hypothetical protein